MRDKVGYEEERMDRERRGGGCRKMQMRREEKIGERVRKKGRDRGTGEEDGVREKADDGDEGGRRCH